MKQCITQEQYESLSDAQKQLYISWVLAKQRETGDYTEVYRSIGHLIWFLRDHDIYFGIDLDKPREVCDTLWSEVKDYLLRQAQEQAE